jgi:hypothetical protein
MTAFPRIVLAAVFAAWSGGVLAGDLVAAARNGDLLMVRSLLDADPKSVLETNTEGETALHWACIKGQGQVAALLLEAGAEVNAKSRKGWTPLHWAAYNGNRDLVSLLIQRGAQVNAVNKELWTPLHVAVYEGNVDVVRLLLERGANAGAKDRSGITPFQTASENWRLMLEALSKADGGIRPEEFRTIQRLVSILSGQETGENDPDRLKARLNELQAQVQALKAAESGLLSEREKVRNLEDRLQTQMAGLKDLEGRLESERQAARTEVSQLQEELAAVRERVRAREQLLAECSREIETNTAQLGRMQADLDAAIEEAGTRLTQADARRAEWERLLAAREAESRDALAGLNNRMEGLRLGMRETGEQIQALLVKLNRLQDEGKTPAQGQP